MINMPKLTQAQPGGGEANPPFLQQRTLKSLSGIKTKPTVTPKPYVTPNETSGAKRPQPMAGAGLPGSPSTPTGTTQLPAQPIPIQMPSRGNPPAMSNPPDLSGKDNPQSSTSNSAPWFNSPIGPVRKLNRKLHPEAENAPNGSHQFYDYYVKEMQNQRDQSLASARADAAARGVYYGTPLTTSSGDIEEAFNKGLGAFSANMSQNEIQNQLDRLRIAAGMSGGGYNPMAGYDPSYWAQLGGYLSQNGNPAGTPPAKPPGYQPPGNRVPGYNPSMSGA